VEKNVVSAKVTVKDFNREIIIDGARATRTYPFTGNSDLFSLKPSTYYSVLPYGDVTQNRVTIGLEGRPDAEMLKREL
ncbi:hypothetical protein QIG88_28090, partial [Klebsiella pneumoniae]|nr:hypothetical protein [Klebsiella pneumoniae]